jgi:carbon storage regulator
VPLILPRYPNESIINGEVVLTLLGMQRDQVRLGFTGHAEVSIHREEIWMRIQQDKALADGGEPWSL